ncbi:hypothetical protein RhiirA4_418251 [Rhizophagus irregularis]|uniref:Crinkler effector protein N-terminal domain-containing protein n=1 Tax=Rhizophagus irregularis TaxID=588596 RepID=A0A2I1G9X7_9GLOM|nr:hypothetical protein RhiirA4_418251 [Rhizophagus irregularis]
MVFCFVVGTDLDSAFEVEGYAGMSISKLKDVIYEKNKDYFEDKKIDANKLNLWLVDIPYDTENVQLRTLQNRSRDMDKENYTLKELEGKKLTPFNDFGDIFTYNSGNICIIVQPPATTDQGHTDVSHIKAKFGYLPRQDGRGGTSLIKKELVVYTAEGISLTDPDTNQRSDLVSSLAKRLEERRVILFWAPPYSGKTSLAQLMENYLVVNNSSELLRVIRVSLLWGSSVGKKCEYDTFCDVWKMIVGVEWYEWVGQCEKIPTVLIMDETQMIYESKEEVDVRCLQGTNLSVIMFAAYGYGAKSAGLSTPLYIPKDNSMSLKDIKFTDKELEEYVKVYCERNFGLSSDDCIISQFILYINYATAGHAGFVRHILQRTKVEMQSKIRNVELTWKEIYRYLNSPGFDQTVNNCRSAPKLYKFNETQKEICEYVYLNKRILFLDNDDNLKNLIKAGIFIVNYLGYLCFSAPLIERSFFQQHYGSKTRANSTPNSLYEFIRRTFTIICDESSKILKYSLGTEAEEDKRLLEQTWQKEFYRAGTRALEGKHFLSCEVGPHFKSNGYIDFYVAGLEWGIKILKEGLNMKGHSKKFESTDEYKEIIERVTICANETAIIDIRSKSKRVQKPKEEFVHVLYSDNYDSFIIECLNKEKIEIKFKKLV